ncbi:hypothetical protein ACVK00_004244 [Burkholderia sp. PvR073]
MLRACSSPARSAVSAATSMARPQRADGEHAGQQRDLAPGRSRQTAHAPEHDLLQRIRVGEKLEQPQQRLETEHQADAE